MSAKRAAKKNRFTEADSEAHHTAITEGARYDELPRW
jgi:hypothetical protein